MVRIKRAYERPEADDGFRVLVDRLWPRGVKKDDAAIDLWAKALAPSAELRQWFGHDPERFAEFARRYSAELADGEAKALLAELKQRAAKETVTLVYGAKDEEHNDAVVLAKKLSARPPRGRARPASAGASRSSRR